LGRHLGFAIQSLPKRAVSAIGFYSTQGQKTATNLPSHLILRSHRPESPHMSMNKSNASPSSKPKTKLTREQRLAAKLKENLRRRKAQTRARATMDDTQTQTEPASSKTPDKSNSTD
jgi:hypothetical protein